MQGSCYNNLFWRLVSRILVVPNPEGGAYQFKDYEWRHFLQYNFSIDGIPIGNHSVTLKAHAGGGYSYSNGSSYVFDVDKSQLLNFSMHIQPSINFLSKHANVTSQFPLNFTINEPLSWMGYSLDNSNNVTIKGNTTLTGLRTGNHSLFVYANNTFNDMAKSEPIFFSVQTPTTPLDWFILATSTPALIVIGVTALLFYRRKKLTNT